MLARVSACCLQGERRAVIQAPATRPTTFSPLIISRAPSPLQLISLFLSLLLQSACGQFKMLFARRMRAGGRELGFSNRLPDILSCLTFWLSLSLKESAWGTTLSELQVLHLDYALAISFWFNNIVFSIRGHPLSTYAKFLGFLTPSPPLYTFRPGS